MAAEPRVIVWLCVCHELAHFERAQQRGDLSCAAGFPAKTRNASAASDSERIWSLIAENRNRVLATRGTVAPYILSQECSAAERHVRRSQSGGSHAR